MNTIPQVPLVVRQIDFEEYTEYLWKAPDKTFGVVRDFRKKHPSIGRPKVIFDHTQNKEDKKVYAPSESSDDTIYY